MNKLQIGVLGVTMALLMGVSVMPVSADLGFANSQCSHWLDPDMADEEMARRQWIFGYLTASARYGDKDILDTDPNQFSEGWRQHCRAHPTDSQETAIEALMAGM